MEELITRFWENLVGRVHGPMKFRFYLQPAMAAILAIRAGLKDAREGRLAYFWAIFTHPSQRRELIIEGLKSSGKIFVIAVILDAVYQVIELQWFYPGEALIVAIALAIVPYFLIRGPVNRIARMKRKS